MTAISLFFKRPQPTQVLRTIGGIVTPMILDATLKESFTGTAEPTQHPIENGADITDHVIIRPKGLAISGMITRTPFSGIADIVKSAGATVGSQLGSALGVFGGVGGSLLGAAGGTSLAASIFGSSDRDLGAVATEFVKLRDARQPVDIQTGLQLYKNYVLTSFSIGRDDKTGGSIKVDLEFKELILVESQITNVAIPKVKGALPGTNNGRQSATALGTDQNAKGASLLKKIARAL